MKIVLINPFQHDPVWDQKIRAFEFLSPPLGLCYMAAYLRQMGQEVEILDSYAERLRIPRIVERVARAAPQLIGITCTTPSILVSVAIAEALKKELGGIPIVLGGHHPSILPAETLAYPCVDFVVRGEGEHAIHELVEHIRTGSPLHGILGLSYRNREGATIHNPRRPPLKNLDDLPMPALDLLKLNFYRDPPHWEIARPSFNVLGSRGCAYRCSFCSHKGVFSRRRARTADNVIAEIQVLVDTYHAKQINFVDPIFPVNEREGLAFCEKLAVSGLDKKIAWLCETHVKCVTSRLLRQMAKSGCRKIIYGIESGNETVLESIGKKCCKEDIRLAVDMAHEAGIEVIGLFIIGFPGETEEMMKETIDFALSLKLSYLKCNTLVPYPGTAVYDQIMAEDSRSLSTNWGDYIPYTSFADGRRAFLPNCVDTKVLDALQRRAYFRFYSRPGFLWRQLSTRDLFRNLKMLAQSIGFR